MAFSTAMLIAWLLLTGGVFWAIHTFKHSPTHVMDWLKPALLLITGGLMLSNPAVGVEAVGLL